MNLQLIYLNHLRDLMILNFVVVDIVVEIVIVVVEIVIVFVVDFD